MLYFPSNLKHATTLPCETSAADVFNFQQVMFIGVSKFRKTNLIFVGPRVQINGTYFRDVLLTKPLLPVMREISGEFFILQQDSAPAHRASETINLVEWETPAFISPDLRSPDLNPVDYRIWG